MSYSCNDEDNNNNRQEKIRPSLRNSKVEMLKERLVNFHLLYSKNARPSLKLLRSNYINIIRNELTEHFGDGKVYQMLINLIQVCFVLHEEIKLSHPVSDDCLDYFFYAACFLIVKLEAPGQFKKLKVSTAEKGLDLDTVFEIEKFILNKLSWKISLSTVEELHILILKEIIKEDEFGEISKSASDWINFSLDEWQIFTQYDQFTFTVACLILCLKANGYTQYTALMEDKYYTNLDEERRIKSCMNEIVNLIEADEESDPMDVEEVVEVEVLNDNDFTKEHSLAVGSSNSSLNDKMPVVEHTEADKPINTQYTANNLCITKQPIQISTICNLHLLQKDISPSNKENINSGNFISLSQTSTTSFSTIFSKSCKDNTTTKLGRKKRCKLSSKKTKQQNLKFSKSRIKQKQSKVSDFIKVRKGKKVEEKGEKIETKYAKIKVEKILKF